MYKSRVAESARTRACVSRSGGVVLGEHPSDIDGEIARDWIESPRLVSVMRVICSRIRDFWLKVDNFNRL